MGGRFRVAGHGFREWAAGGCVRDAGSFEAAQGRRAQTTGGGEEAAAGSGVGKVHSGREGAGRGIRKGPHVVHAAGDQRIARVAVARDKGHQICRRARRRQGRLRDAPEVVHAPAAVLRHLQPPPADGRAWAQGAVKKCLAACCAGLRCAGQRCAVLCCALPCSAAAAPAAAARPGPP